MNVTEKGDTFNCSCGFSWQRGQSGAHNCEPGLYRQITAMQQRLDAVTADNFGLSSAAYTLLQMLNEPEGLPDAVARMEKALENPATDAIINALQQKLDALTAENVALKEAIDFATADDMWVEQHDGMLDYRYTEWYVDVLMRALETPATDAQVNALQAEDLQYAIDILTGIDASPFAIHALQNKASQLRNGEHVGEEGV